MKEIEHKFTVDIEKWNRVIKPEPIRIVQGYVFKDEQKTVRVRIKNDRAYLAVKGNVNGIVRDEFEYAIPVGDAEELLDKYTEKRLHKLRYEIKVGSHIWEIDVFKGKLENLVLAEIELSSEDEAYMRPEWILEDVSTDPNYFNAVLIDKC